MKQNNQEVNQNQAGTKKNQNEKDGSVTNNGDMTKGRDAGTNEHAIKADKKGNDKKAPRK
jgi:hypothetical protein